MNLRKITVNYVIRHLVVLVMVIACMSLSSNALSAQPMEGEERVPQSAIDNLAFGNNQDLIVLFNDEDVLNQSSFLRGVYGVSEDTPEILAYKSSRYDEIKQGVLSTLPSEDIEVLMDYSHLPMMFLKFKSLNSLNQLLNNYDVVRVYENQAYRHFLSQSLPLINQPQVAASGRIGTGTAVAILDTGVDYTRSAFGNCTSPGVPSTCKVIYAQDFAPSDGQRDVSPYHGTNVAGISLGVAPDTRIIALDVFSGNVAYSNHIINAINWCIANKSVYNIVAINMSLGGGRAYSPCSGDIFATPIANAKAAGILSSVASGNDAYKDSISSPACAPAAVSVGAVYDSNVGSKYWSNCTDLTTYADKVTCFSNSAYFLTILAPGSVITAAGVSMSGTSQAAPHIAGSIAVLKGSGAHPSETPDQIISRMTSTGVPITDWANGIIKPRIDLQAAAGSETAPTANFTGTPTSGTAPLNVNFTDTSTGSPTSWSWNFGDSGTSTLQNPSHTYTNPGTYTVSLTATNAYGSDTETKTNYITVGQPSYTVTANANGTGTGNVSSNPAGINYTYPATNTGNAQFNSGSNVVLTAAANLGSTATWNGTCTAAGGTEAGNGTATATCTFANLDGNKTATVTFNALQQTYSISGTVTTPGGMRPGNPIPDVTITGSGGCSGSTSTNSNGNYTLTGIPDGSTCTVTPSKSGYTFTPTSRSVTINGANKTGQDFTGTYTGVTTYSISGRVTTSGGSPLQGVIISGSGGCSGLTSTNSNGDYTLTGIPDGSTCTVTPSKSGYTFTPTSRSVTINGANKTGQDFVGTPGAITYSISGKVKKPDTMTPGKPISGVTMTLSGTGCSGSTLTGADGNYIFTGLSDGVTCTITSSKSGYTFTPTSRTVTISGANVTGQDFTGTPN